MAWVDILLGDFVYSYEGMRSVMKHNECVLKVLCPQSQKANAQKQAEWQKSGVVE